MSDFAVVLADLDALAGRFAAAARDYEDAATTLSPEPADSGDGSCDHAIRAVLDMLAVLHASMTASIDDHSDKLRCARDEYDRTEDVNKNRFLWDNLNEDFR